MRKTSWLALAGIGIALAGCGPKSEEKPVNTGSNSGGTAPAGKSLSVALVLDQGGVDDESFNKAAWDGLKKAEAELGVKAKYVQSKEPTEYKTNLSTLAEKGNDIVFAVGFMMEDALAEVAPKYPKVMFAIIDGNAPKLDNCVSIKFKEEEGCFQAGYLAAKMSKTGGIGFVGGVDGPLLKRFFSGYAAGARTARPDIRVQSKFVDNWTDVAKAKEAASSMFADKVDILFAAAGKAGLGVLDAVNEKGAGYYGIGVDLDQDAKHPGRVLTSMMKGVDSSVFDTIKSLKDGKFTAGTRQFNLKEGGVKLSEMKYTRKDIPAEVLTTLDKLKQMIGDGKIVVPTNEAELTAFVAPKL